MYWFLKRTIIMLCALTLEGNLLGQKAPCAPNHPWDASAAKQQLTMPPLLPLPPVLDPAKTYTLSELVNIAESNNPDTRVGWENAKARAGDLGICQSYPVSNVGSRSPGKQFPGGDFLWQQLAKAAFCAALLPRTHLTAVV